MFSVWSCVHIRSTSCAAENTMDYFAESSATFDGEFGNDMGRFADLDVAHDGRLGNAMGRFRNLAVAAFTASPGAFLPERKAKDNAPVAHLDRATASGAVGGGFEPRRVHHFFALIRG